MTALKKGPMPAKKKPAKNRARKKLTGVTLADQLSPEQRWLDGLQPARCTRFENESVLITGTLSPKRK
jgi:hypothetical protein